MTHPVTQGLIDLGTYVKMRMILRIGRRAVRKAQAESREKGVPNVYSIDGVLMYEQPDGELKRTDP